MTDANESSGKALDRRALLLGSLGLIGTGSALGACESGVAPASRNVRASAQDPIAALVPLGSPPWPSFDPFLFCVHHKDDYPEGNAALGPNASLQGRNIGDDFGGKDGWSMYHGDVVPGFPRHPHRGFETVTITRRGFVDHSDSLGATARYGKGDVQWMTAGSGIVHAEMFPLVDISAANPAELFQIWLNLPSRNKFVRPHFSMFWQSQIPTRQVLDSSGRATAVTVIAGKLDGARGLPPPPDSWASQSDADVAIWSIVMAAGARFELPPAAPSSERTLYFFSGSGLTAGERAIPSKTALRLRSGSVALKAGPAPIELLLLQGRPIGEPVVKHGPFVMNQRSEIEQAVRDYRQTQFGGWPWGGSGPVHARDSGRFAIHADGRRERG